MKELLAKKRRKHDTAVEGFYEDHSVARVALRWGLAFKRLCSLWDEVGMGQGVREGFAAKTMTKMDDDTLGVLENEVHFLEGVQKARRQYGTHYGKRRELLDRLTHMAAAVDGAEGAAALEYEDAQHEIELLIALIRLKTIDVLETHASLANQCRPYLCDRTTFAALGLMTDLEMCALANDTHDVVKDSSLAAQFPFELKANPFFFVGYRADNKQPHPGLLSIPMDTTEALRIERLLLYLGKGAAYGQEWEVAFVAAVQAAVVGAMEVLLFSKLRPRRAVTYVAPVTPTHGHGQSCDDTDELEMSSIMSRGAFNAINKKRGGLPPVIATNKENDAAPRSDRWSVEYGDGVNGSEGETTPRSPVLINAPPTRNRRRTNSDSDGTNSGSANTVIKRTAPREDTQQQQQPTQRMHRTASVTPVTREDSERRTTHAMRRLSENMMGGRRPSDNPGLNRRPSHSMSMAGPPQRRLSAIMDGGLHEEAGSLCVNRKKSLQVFQHVDGGMSPRNAPLGASMSRSLVASLAARPLSVPVAEELKNDPSLETVSAGSPGPAGQGSPGARGWPRRASGSMAKGQASRTQSPTTGSRRLSIRGHGPKLNRAWNTLSVALHRHPPSLHKPSQYEKGAEPLSPRSRFKQRFQADETPSAAARVKAVVHQWSGADTIQFSTVPMMCLYMAIDKLENPNLRVLNVLTCL